MRKNILIVLVVGLISSGCNSNIETKSLEEICVLAESNTKNLDEKMAMEIYDELQLITEGSKTPHCSSQYFYNKLKQVNFSHYECYKEKFQELKINYNRCEALEKFFTIYDN